MQNAGFDRPVGADLWLMLRLPGKLWRAAGRLHTGGSLGARCNRVKFFARGLAFPVATAHWFQFLASPALAGVVRGRPKLFQKLQRPYLMRTLRTRQRLAVLEQHHRFAVSQFSPALLEEIYAPAGKILAELPATGEDHYELRLKPSWMDKEGELALALVQRNTGRILFSLTFCVTRGATGQAEIVIGGLQGSKLANHRELIIALTRHWHGLRPKALLLFALQQLAAGWGLGRIRAVSDGAHIYQHWRRRQAVASSYDAWWQEAGGQLAGDGLYDLPARFEPRAMATLKANKRGMYRHRYGMLENLGQQMATRLHLPPPLRLVTAVPPEIAVATQGWTDRHFGPAIPANRLANLPAEKG